MGETAVPGGPPGLTPGRGALWQQSRGGDWSAATAAAGSAAREAALGMAYHAHYPSLVRLAALLTCDAQLGQQVAEDSFVALFSSAARSSQAEAELAALLRLVVTRSRQAGRGGTRPQSGPATEFAGMPVVLALSALRRAQREAVVLTYYLDLGEEQAAAAAGVSLAALRRNLCQAVSVLRSVTSAPS